jgi:ketosteroid isomerase-like protein
MASVEREILDRMEISELRSAYAKAVDNENYERAHEIFADDATVHYRAGTCHGAKEVESYWREKVDYGYSVHTAQMPELTVDGDQASGHWYMIVFYETSDGEEGYALGWYEDEYRRIEGDWKITELDMEITQDTTGYHL